MSESIYELAKENQSSLSVMTAKSSVSKRSSVVNCRICLSSILEPASLSCGHRFCETCLKQYWEAKNKPVYLVCPLCRTSAFNVDFAKKEPPSSESPSADFRKTFNPLQNIAESMHNHNAFCFKLCLIVPALYYLWKWLPLANWFTKS